MVRALTDRERSEFDALGVTVTGECGCAAPDRLPEREVPEAWDWALLRKFNDFWPSTMSAPHEFPWLGDLVTRERAWRWASQFPRFFALVEASDTEVIRGFIARTLTEVEPPSDFDGTKGRGCCKRRDREPPPAELPPITDHPSCTQEYWVKCDGCTEGAGTLYFIFPDCSEMQAGGKCTQIAPQCPGYGPIQPDEAMDWSSP